MVKNIDELDVTSINERSDVGYILEVDLKYLMNYMNYTMIKDQCKICK